MLDLLYQYKQTLKETKLLEKELENIPEEERTIDDNEDIKQYNSMISHLQFVIEWLERGRQPGAKRGYDRREVYKRMVCTDPEVLDSVYFEESHQHQEIDEWDKQRLEDALSVLTEKEKDMYLLHHEQGFSYKEIASLVGVKKSTVQTNMKRAENKIKQRKKISLLCM